MKNIILSVLLISCPVIASELACSKNGTAVLYINGVDNEPKDALDSFERVQGISDSVKFQLDKNSNNQSFLYPDYQYNRSQGIGLDIIEFAAQKIRSYLPNVLNPYKIWSRYLRLGSLPDDLTNEQVKEALDSDLLDLKREILGMSPVAQDTILLSQRIGGFLANDRKVLLVSHSQGNLFANEAYRVLQNSLPLDKIKFYKNLMVATPATYNATNGPWMTLDSDKVIKLFGLSANYEAKDDLELIKFQEKDNFVHNFLKIYTSPTLKGAFTSASFSFPFSQSGTMEQIFTGNLIETAKLIPGNCSCEGSPNNSRCAMFGNDPEDGEFRMNPDGSCGGFVAKTANVSASLNLDPEVEICGNTQFDVVTGDNFVSNAKINNSSVTSSFGPFHISGSVIDGSTILSDFNNVEGVEIHNSHIMNSIFAWFYQMNIFNSAINESISGGGVIVHNSTVNAPITAGLFNYIYVSTSTINAEVKATHNIYIENTTINHTQSRDNVTCFGTTVPLCY